MKFSNETPFAARMLRTEISEGRMLNATIARVRYSIEEDGRLQPLPHDQQPADVRTEPLELGAYGTLFPDHIHPRTGVDIIVLGDVLLEEPVREADVSIEAGDYNVSLRVLGHRVWQRGAMGGLSPTKPIKFSHMPLTWANAYGGGAKSDYGDIPSPKNPDGKGFIMFEKHAVDVQLPNVELPDQLIKRWDDRPEPAGFGPYPMHWAMRSERIMSHEPDGSTMTLHPERGMFDHAVPYLAGKALDSPEVRIVGMRSHEIRFNLPGSPFEVAAVVGDTQYQQPLRLEEVLVDLRPESADAGDGPLVELCYRRSFHYAYVPRQQRRAWLKLRTDA